MSGYIEKTSGYKIKILGGGETTAQRQFLKDPDGPDSLPKIGDVHSREYPRVWVQDMEMQLMGDDPTRELWTINYSSNEIENDPNTSSDDLFRSLEIGGEFLNVGKIEGAKFTWSGLSVPQDLFKRIAVATIRVIKVYLDYEKLLTYCKEYGGKVNSETFMGQSEEQVLFAGASATEFANEAGFTRWRVTFTFQLRCIDGTETADEKDGGWNHIWDKKYNHFDTTDKPIYQGAWIGKVLDMPEPGAGEIGG